MSDGEKREPPATAKPVPTDTIVKPPIAVPTAGGLGEEELEKQALTETPEQQRFRSELGIVGILFGGNNEEPGNVAATVIVLCLLFLGVVWSVDTYRGSKQAELVPFKDLLTVFVGLIGIALGYLFGRSK